MFTLIELPYAKDVLAPVISAQTLEFHHGKHLQGYVDNLNKLIAGTAFENLPLEEIVKQATGGMFNNAGQILNHNLYFTQFAPKPAAPAGKVGESRCFQGRICSQRRRSFWQRLGVALRSG